MNAIKLNSLILVGTILTACASAGAQQFNCDKTYNNPDGDWEDFGSWDEGSPPSPTENACFPAGTRALVKDSFETCAGIKVDAGGEVEVSGDEPNTRLTISADSIINGELKIGSGGELFIDGDLTFEGTGRIYMSPEFGGSATQGDTNSPDLNGVDAQSKLTLKGIHAGAWTPDEWDDQTGTLVLTGGGHIRVQLVNQAHVKTAEEWGVSTSFPCCDDPLWIHAPASGDGFWIAESLGDLEGNGCHPSSSNRCDNGVLDFRDSVSGSGTFVVVALQAPVPNLPGLGIQINALPGILTGTVRLEDGLFKVNTVCDGGPRDGELCPTDQFCAKCQGGSNPGVTCQDDTDCFGGGVCVPGTCRGEFDTSGDLIMNGGTIEAAPNACAYFD